jgi:antibiotic biosynthesis monooxygenase (ABM) superfamily enzyme
MPVTVTEGRSIAEGHEQDYQAWIQRTLVASERYPGNEGIIVLAPEPGQPGERYLIFRFVDETARRTWSQSTEWARLRDEAAAFSTPHVQVATGAEPWFTLKGQPIREAPKWKMALAIVPSAYVVGGTTILLASTILDRWPFLAVNLIVTVVLAVVLTYVGLPLTTRLLHTWLYPRQSGGG